jgi:hypothetical protein
MNFMLHLFRVFPIFHSFCNEKGSKPSIFNERGLPMNSTNAVPIQRQPLPYVPEIPADFLLMLKTTTSQQPH